MNASLEIVIPTKTAKDIMAIELTIRHALGEQTVTIDATGPDAPAIIGSAGDAKVRLASSRAPGRLAAMFAMEDAWGIEPIDDSIPVSVNGKPIHQTTPLRAGDVVDIGTLVTMKVMRINVDTREPREVSSSIAGGWEAMNAARVSTPGLSANRSRVRTKPRKPSGAPIGVLVLSGIVGIIVLGIGLDRVQRGRFFWQPVPVLEQASTSTTNPTSPPERPLPTGNNPESIFDDPIGSKTPPAGTSLNRSSDASTRKTKDEATRVSTQTGNAPSKQDLETTDAKLDPSAGEETSPGDRDPDIARLIDLQRFGAPPMRVYQFQEFLRQKPDHPRAIEVRVWRDDALDLLWWMRIRELSDRREAFNKRIAEHTRDYNPAVLANLPELRRSEIKGVLAEMIAERDAISKQLLETFNWGESASPDPLDEAQIKPLGADRHAMKYDAFVQKILRTVNQTQGRLAW